MRLEILLATMFYERENADFLDIMNVQSDIIIGNQCDYNENSVCEHNGHAVTVLSRHERGVGKNRNTCLFYSEADIVLFADNDVRYYDGYAAKIEEFYRTHPDADLVIFNFKEKRGDEPLHDIHNQNKRASLSDVTRFGTWAVTAKRKSILKNRISFSLLFGGGATYGCGEDSLFLRDCCKNGMRVYLSNVTLGEIWHKESTWFTGINEKYIFDKGALFKAMCPRIYRLAIYRHVVKHRKMYAQFGSVKKVCALMLDGARDYESTGNK